MNAGAWDSGLGEYYDSRIGLEQSFCFRMGWFFWRPLAMARCTRLNQIDIYISQVIIPGFGGVGMMTYWNNPTPIVGWRISGASL